MLFIGDDWAEGHHDVELVDDEGQVLARRRLPEGIDGVARLHGLVAEHLGGSELEPEQVRELVKVGIETDRGPWVAALVAAGYEVYAINPVSVARYRERHSTSRAKSDGADAHLLAEIVRVDRAHHRSAGRGLRCRRGDQAGRPAPSDPGLGTDSTPAAAACGAAGVLPRGAGRLRGPRRPRRPRARRSGAGPGPSGPVDAAADHQRAAPRQAPRRRGQGDPDPRRSCAPRTSAGPIRYGAPSPRWWPVRRRF